MTKPELFVGIDIGTSGTKTMAVDLNGVVHAAASAAHPILTPGPGLVEQDPADWWGSVCRTTRQVVAALPDGASNIAAIGLSGHMSSPVLIDAAGRPLRACITVADGRGADEADWLTRTFGPRLVRLTGGQPGTSDVAPKLLWLKRHEPETYANAAQFLFAKDYVRYLLTGDPATEPTDAGNTFFLDLAARTWDLDLYGEMGLDPRKLPRLVGTTDVVGQVTPHAGTETGLLPGTPVIAGGADMAASVTGTAAVRPGVVAVTIGTSAQVTTPLSALPPGGDGRVSFHPHPIPGLLYMMGSIFGGGLTLRWLAHAFGEDRELDRRGSAYFEKLSNEASRANPGSEGAMFLPFIVGSGTPEFDPTIRGTFLGLSLRSGRPELVRAALEGVAYNARECVGVVEDLGLPVNRVNLAGGGAASAVWSDIIAAVLGVSLHPCRVRDASALGAAAFAAVGLGAYADVEAASEALVRFADPIDPAPSSVERYREGFTAYRAARVALGNLYRDQARADGERPNGASPAVASTGAAPEG